MARLASQLTLSDALSSFVRVGLQVEAACTFIVYMGLEVLAELHTKPFNHRAICTA